MVLTSCNNGGGDPPHMTYSPLKGAIHWGDHSWMCNSSGNPMFHVQNGDAAMIFKVTGKTSTQFIREWRFAGTGITLQNSQLHSASNPDIDYVTGCIDDVQVPYNDEFTLFAQYSENGTCMGMSDCFRYYHFENFPGQTVNWYCRNVTYSHLSPGVGPNNQNQFISNCL